MSPVRRFVKEDIAEVADLHRTVFRLVGVTSGRWREPYEAYFQEVFLNGLWQDEELGSLVYERSDGRIVGFLGVHRRKMLFNKEQVRMAVCSQFVVHPQQRGVVGLQLVRALFDGHQDLAITDEANDAVRRIWESRGAITCRLYSLHWTRPLRPAQLALSLLRRRKRLGLVARACGPFAWSVDEIAARLDWIPFRQPLPRLSGEDLDEATFLTCLLELTDGRSLRPQYDARSLKWILERAGLRSGGGRLEKVVIRHENRRIAGWYLYYVEPSGIGEVLQIAAAADSINEVLEHLLYHAWVRGVIALSGRPDPVFIHELADRHCLLHGGSPWMLVHAKRPELLQAISRGDAFLTRLEGEWCLRFRLDRDQGSLGSMQREGGREKA